MNEQNQKYYSSLEAKKTWWTRYVEVIMGAVVGLVGITTSVFALFNTINTQSSVKDLQAIIENNITNEQTVDVIQARETDVLIKTDDKWIIIPMFNETDIMFSNEIIEKQYNSGESDLPRLDLFNYENEDWSSRDSFTYTLPYISFNQNKMLSLEQFITKISIEFLFYENDVNYQNAYIDLNLDTNYLNVFINVSPNIQFVTKQIDDGIEKIKINIIIEFDIDGTKKIPYVFDDFINVNEDF